MSDELWPCQRNPDRWFSNDRRELGKAKHECRRHCGRLVEYQREAYRSWRARARGAA